jgi:MFS family permease
MRVSALVLSIIGGVFGILFGLMAMAVGGASEELEKGSGETVIWLGLGAILAAVVGIAAGGFYFGGVNRTLVSWILLIAAVCHLVAISYFGIAGFIFLLLAAMLAWFGRRESPATPGFEGPTKLRELTRLHDEGILTDTEYEAKRQQLVEAI